MKEHAPQTKAPEAVPKSATEPPKAVFSNRPPAHSIPRLQRTIGNQGVQRFIQAKLVIGAADDEYEEEADRVAGRIMRMPTVTENTQHHCSCGGIAGPNGKCENCRRKLLSIQRKTHASKSEMHHNVSMPAVVTKVLQSPGRPLDSSIRSFMEPRFGTDFSGVRIHTDGEAPEAARSLQAKAFTSGQDVVFGAGQFAPESGQGNWLLAHELTHVLQQQGESSELKIQREPSTAGMTSATAPASVAVPAGPIASESAATNSPGVPFQGRMFTTDSMQLRRVLETMIAELGQSGAETVAYRLLGASAEEKIALQFRGYDPKLVDKVQAAFGPVLKEVQADQKTYIELFQSDAAAATRLLLTQSHTELKKEEAKYTRTWPSHEMPDADGLRVAAKQLAAKRKATDTAASEAEKANRAMVDQNKQKSSFPVGGIAPQVPYFPNVELRKKAGEVSNAWWKLEHEYGALRVSKEKTFPALAMYTNNDDGGAAGRLGDLPTWGLWADSRLMDKVAGEAKRRVSDNLRAQEDMKDVAKVWSLPRMLDLTVKQRKSTAFQERWVKDQGTKVRQAEKEREELIAAVAIGIALVTTALTLGAALPESAAGVAIVSTMAAGAQAVSAGLTIAIGYQHLQTTLSEAAATDTALDKTNAISGGDPSFLWLALDLGAVLLELGAAKAAFQAMRTSIQNARNARNMTKLIAELNEIAKAHRVPRATLTDITGRAAAEIESLPGKTVAEQIEMAEAKSAKSLRGIVDGELRTAEATAKEIKGIPDAIHPNEFHELKYGLHGPERCSQCLIFGQSLSERTKFIRGHVGSTERIKQRAMYLQARGDSLSVRAKELAKLPADGRSVRESALLREAYELEMHMAEIEHEAVGIVSKRLPASDKGRWSDTENPGTGIWYPNKGHPAHKFCGSDGIPYHNGYPNLSLNRKFGVEGGEVNLLPGKKVFIDGVQQDVAMLGKRSDFDLADALAAQTTRMKDYKAFRDWRYNNGLTWHHRENGLTMQLVWTELHASIPHIGGALFQRGIIVLAP